MSHFTINCGEHLITFLLECPYERTFCWDPSFIRMCPQKTPVLGFSLNPFSGRSRIVVLHEIKRPTCCTKSQMFRGEVRNEGSNHGLPWKSLGSRTSKSVHTAQELVIEYYVAQRELFPPCKNRFAEKFESIKGFVLDTRMQNLKIAGRKKPKKGERNRKSNCAPHVAYSLGLYLITPSSLSTRLHHCRTKEQLGYRVDCGVRVTHRVLGFCFRVQSADYAPDHLHQRVEAFLTSFRKHLVKLPNLEKYPRLISV
jgi:hypothetical protein